MKALKYILIFILIVVLACVVAYGINEKLNDAVFVTEYEYVHEEVPQNFDGYRIMMISDLHNAPFSEQIQNHISKQKPDIIVITGDMVQLPDSNLDETLKIVEAAEGIPVYAVSGNHDTQCGSYAEIKKTLTETGVRVLDDDSTIIGKEGESLLLIGVKDPVEDNVSVEKISKKRKHIQKSLPDGPSFSVLLNHRADLYPHFKDTDVDLILSGHLHGGIIRIPFVGGVISKEDGKFFPDYDYGMFADENAADMIVNGGCDKNSQKKRFFNPPEIVMITLKNKLTN